MLKYTPLNGMMRRTVCCWIGHNQSIRRSGIAVIITSQQLPINTDTHNVNNLTPTTHRAKNTRMHADGNELNIIHTYMHMECLPHGIDVENMNQNIKMFIRLEQIELTVPYD